MAAFYLNPQFQYGDTCRTSSISVQKNFLDVVEKLFVDDVEAHVRIAKEVMLFRDALEGFRRPMTIAARSTMLPGKSSNIIHYVYILVCECINLTNYQVFL